MSLLQLLLPKRCYACDALLESNELQICTSCRHHLPVLTSLDLQYYLTQLDFRHNQILHFDVLFLFEKNNSVQTLVHKLKYKGYRHIGKIIGNLHLNSIKQLHHQTPFDAIITIPLHKKRLQERGYNQLDEYARAISKNLETPIISDVLTKIKCHKRMAITNHIDRSQSIKGSFALKNTSQLANKHVLLLDDIVTTGATLNEAISTIQTFTNCQISVACMALTKPED